MQCASRWAPRRRTPSGAPCSRSPRGSTVIPVLVRGAAVTDRRRLTSTGGTTDPGSTHRSLLTSSSGKLHSAGFPTTRPTPVAPGGGRVGRRPIPQGRAAPFRRPVLPDRIPQAVGKAVLPAHPGKGSWARRLRASGGLDGGRQSALSPHSVRRTFSRDPLRPQATNSEIAGHEPNSMVVNNGQSLTEHIPKPCVGGSNPLGATAELLVSAQLKRWIEAAGLGPLDVHRRLGDHPGGGDEPLRLAADVG